MGKEFKYIRTFDLIDECRRQHDIRRGTDDDQPGHGVHSLGELHALRALRGGNTRLRPGPAGLAVSRLRRGSTAGGGVPVAKGHPPGRPTGPTTRTRAARVRHGRRPPGPRRRYPGRTRPAGHHQPPWPPPATPRHCDPAARRSRFPAAFRAPPSSRSGSLRSCRVVVPRSRDGLGVRPEPNGF
jgi:hypothetical protein